MPKRQTFIDLPEADFDDLADARVVVFGASEASPYVAGAPSHSADVTGNPGIRPTGKTRARTR